MRYKRVFLIQPFYRERHYHFAYLPVGLGYIAEYLKARGITVGFLDMGMGLGRRYKFRRLAKTIEDFAPDLIGVSMFTYRYKDTFALIEKIKAAFPDIRIAAGGPHVSIIRKKALEDCAAIDYGITMEGEETLFELCGGREISEIRGLIYRDGDEVKYSGPRDFIKDIDEIPFPRYEGFNLEGYPASMTILTSRGCPQACIFCPVKATMGAVLRKRSAESVINELEHWYRKGWRKFGIVDDNFTFDKERAIRICDGISSRGMKDVRLTCGNGIRADRIDGELLKKMRDAGFYEFSIGVEAGNDRVLKNIKKGETIETLESAIRLSCEMGFNVRLFFLLGSPGETEKDVESSMRLALKYPVVTARFYNIIPFPMTELYDWVKDRGLFLREPGEYLNNASVWDTNDPVFETPELPASARIRMANRADRLRRKVEEAYYLGRMGRDNAFFRLIAYLYMTDFIQRGLLRIKFVRMADGFLKDIFFRNRLEETSDVSL